MDNLLTGAARSSFVRRAGPQLVLGLLLAAFGFTGAMGLDFGTYWDESAALERVARPLQEGVFLPGRYNYPSMVFDIGCIALLPETVPFLLRTAKQTRPSYADLYENIVPKTEIESQVAFAKGKSFLLRYRAICLGLTALTGAWIFLAVRACKRSGWEAVFASAVILTSWEIAYHARWVAPDGILMQFAALWLMLFALALHSSLRPLLWLRLAAAAAGLACGTKYQGGILLLPVLIHAFVVARALSPGRPVSAVAKELTYIIGIFATVFLATTPGALLEPLNFWQSLRSVGGIYATGHGGYTVSAVTQHGYLLLVYLTTVLMSPWPLAALVLSICAALGATTMWKKQPLAAALLLCAPLAFVLFAVCYRVMIVRNYLLLAPFMALFSARGAFVIWQSVARAVWLRRLVVTCFVGLFIANAIFLFLAAQTIRGHAAVSFGADTVAHLKKHIAERYFLSPEVAKVVRRERATPTNATGDLNGAQRYMLFADEIPPEDWHKWSCNRLGQYRVVSGPLEVNFDYYASWLDGRRIIDLPLQRAREMHILSKP